ncbi:MAG: DUF2207 domain-containing protein [Saprospiraceae bacterium]|nr:DUF2207 domain-containing protein [Saprospiraceae bacterium]
MTELYTLVPVRRMENITRYLYPYIADQQSSIKDWMGDQSRYIVSKIEVKGTKKCRTMQSASVCLDISDLPVGEERTIEIKYRTYGNFFESPDVPENLLAYAFVPINKGIDEPVLKSSIQIEFPDGNADKTVFRSDIYNGETFLRQARIQQLNSQTYYADLGDNQTFLQPQEKMTFRLYVSEAYFTEDVTGYELRLFWLNNRFLFLPMLVFLGLYYAWNRWGRDEDFTKMVHYYPPEDVPPSEAGILIDDHLHDRDLLALIPYWGAKGYIEIEEIGTDSIWKKDDYIFKLNKRIPYDIPKYERKMFNGIFGASGEPGKEVTLSSLKNKFYKTMDEARKLLEKEIKQKSFYVPYTRGASVFIIVLGIIMSCIGLILFVLAKLGAEDFASPELGLGLFATGILGFIFGRIMPKKAPMGLEAYKKLAGF